MERGCRFRYKSLRKKKERKKKTRKIEKI